jgi:hypothetical protein
MMSEEILIRIVCREKVNDTCLSGNRIAGIPWA